MRSIIFIVFLILNANTISDETLKNDNEEKTRSYYYEEDSLNLIAAEKQYGKYLDLKQIFEEFLGDSFTKLLENEIKEINSLFVYFNINKCFNDISKYAFIKKYYSSIYKNIFANGSSDKQMQKLVSLEQTYFKDLIIYDLTSIICEKINFNEYIKLLENNTGSFEHIKDFLLKLASKIKFELLLQNFDYFKGLVFEIDLILTINKIKV